jgi:hypothetical protein
MRLLHPGDTFPRLTLNIPGAQAIQVPGWLAGEFGVVLFNRGAQGPYCTAQLRAFQRAVTRWQRPASGWPRSGSTTSRPPRSSPPSTASPSRWATALTPARSPP